MSRSPRSSRSRERGFSMLEAIVALTVFSICALSLYGWLAVNVNALSRVEARHRQVDDGRLAMAMLETVNPMVEPSGERELPGGVQVRWSSRELVAPKPGVGPGGNPLIFDLGLYDLDVTILRDGHASNRFTVRRAGWKTVRELGYGDS